MTQYNKITALYSRLSVGDEDRTAARKAEIEAMKAEIRQEDQKKGIFYVVADCPEGEPTVIHSGETYDGRKVFLPAASM